VSLRLTLAGPSADRYRGRWSSGAFARRGMWAGSLKGSAMSLFASRAACGPRRSASSRRFFAALACVGFLLPGCGAGGVGGSDDGDEAPAVVAIQTTSLPSAGVGAPYSATLTASGGTGPYTWTLTSGSLPQGLAMSPAGAISGTASTIETSTFGVSVTDSSAPAQVDTASYSLAVSPFDASISSLRFGDAWTGDAYPLSGVGSPTVTFTLVVNQSGGAIEGANPGAGTATYRAGASAGVDRVRATAASGAFEDIDVVVQPHPVANMTASYSSSDVWHMRFEGKHDATHPFSSDFNAALALAGLRSPSSTSVVGTTADELASMYLRQQVLRSLNTMFLNQPDGSPAASGLEITFPFEEPDAPHFSPAAGAVSSPAFNQFNVLSMIAGGGGGVIGTAYLDSTSNGAQENNTTTSQAGELGVFVDEITAIFNNAYGNTVLRAAPVGSTDVPSLKAALYGTAKPAGVNRYDEIKRIGEGLGRTLAAVAAHEVGHSIGLVHTSPSQSGSIMNAGAVISPSASYAFVASDVTILRNALPGPGRGGVPFTVDMLRFAGPDEGDVGGAPTVVCGCRLHRGN
jgi:hypothetical protein